MRISDWSSDVCASDLLGPCVLAQRGAVEIELLDLLQPALEFLEVCIFFLKLRIGELVDSDLFGDLGLEISAATEELAVFLVAVGLEAGQHLLLLPAVQRHGLEDHSLDLHQIGRASCRERVCRTCRSRCAPNHSKKKHNRKKQRQDSSKT